LDTDSIYTRISDTVSKLDYDKINARGGMDYIKSEVIRELGDYINEEDFRGLYISDINRGGVHFDQLDMGVNQSSPSESSKPNINEIFEAFHQKK